MTELKGARDTIVVFVGHCVEAGNAVETVEFIRRRNFGGLDSCSTGEKWAD
jgi:hypothetical protein